jgi:muramoyltetrapeptide carboxypeptidase
MSHITAPIRIAVVAASSAVPQVELELGVAHLRSAGMMVEVQANCPAQSFVFAGDDPERAESFYAAAMSNSIDVLWCACGGYGSARILPLLDRLAVDRGTPPVKLLVGFSDATALMSFVRERWGWKTTHAPMVISRTLRELDATMLQAIARCQTPQYPWGRWQLKWIGTPPARATEAELIGGNLSVWNSLTGTLFAESAKDRILFLEDIDEPPYRIDRMATQLRQSGRLDGVAAIVLGGFADCEDRVSQVLASADSRERVPLRRSYSVDEALEFSFGQLGIPVAAGLPVGHGAFSTPLPLGGKYRLDCAGILAIVQSPGEKI